MEHLVVVPARHPLAVGVFHDVDHGSDGHGLCILAHHLDRHVLLAVEARITLVDVEVLLIASGDLPHQDRCVLSLVRQDGRAAVEGQLPVFQNSLSHNASIRAPLCHLLHRQVAAVCDVILLFVHSRLLLSFPLLSGGMLYMPLFCPNSKANVHHILHNDFLTGSAKLYSVHFFEELHRCHLSDAGRQPAVQCICRESPLRIPVCQ